MALEKLKVQIEADASNFKKGMEEAKQSLSSLEQKIYSIKNDDALKNFGYTYDEMVKKMSKMPAFYGNMPNAEYQNFADTIGEIDAQVQKAIEDAPALERLKYKLKDIKNEVEFKGGKNKLGGELKKIGLALLGARSIYAGIRRAMSSYLSQNEELQNKLNAMWYALGSMFAPLLDSLLNGIIKIVYYIDVIAKTAGLAGINMANFGKNAEKAKKALAGIDEINNLSSSDNTSYSNPFADVKIDPELQRFLETVGEALSVSLPVKLIKWIEGGDPLTTDDWIGALQVGLGLLALGVPILSLTGGASGMLISIAGIATITFGIVQLVKNSNKLTKDQWKTIFNAGLALTTMGFTITAIGVAAGSIAGTVGGVVLALAGVITITWTVKHLLGNGSTKVAGGTFAMPTDLYNELNSKLSGVSSSSVPNQGGGKVAVPLYEEGTNYVPNDGLAYIHEGEAVVPKKYNNDLYGNVSAEELNLLSAINDQLEALNRKNYTIELDGENVAKKIDNSLQALSNRQGSRVFEVAR